jgi:eukaryotic-like serine/threonine-protein kinase
MSDRPTADPRGIFGTQYLVDVTRPLPDAGGGMPAYAANSRLADATPLMALRVDRYAPPCTRALLALAAGIEGLATPMAHGVGPPIDGKPAYYVVYSAPSGPPVSIALKPWAELTLIDHVMRPLALILDNLHARGLTHRGIRLNNVFLSGPNRPVTLGAAWAAPPAMHQPAVYETAYTALCHPSARGDGRTSDDVYALGVLLVTLALGRVPMEGMDDKAIMYRKLEVGDYTAIAGSERLPPMLGDIVRGMLADDPDHRPPPSLLRDPVGARGRRVAARPPSRAQRPLKFGATTVWNNRTLALGMALEPDEALTAIMGGTLMYWLRRALGDSALAVRLEELVRQHAFDVSTDNASANAMLVMRAIANTELSMPLCWRGLAIFPEGLGPALVTNPETEADLHHKLQEIVAVEAQGTWAAMREERTPAAPQRLEARQRRAIQQIKGPAGGLPRLAYTLNSLTPCASPLLEGRWITGIRELIPVLDTIAASAPKTELLEPQIAAFIAARSERWLEQEVQALAIESDEPGHALTVLRLLAELQNRYHPGILTGLTAWVAARAKPLVECWQNRERRSAVEQQLKTLAEAGFLQPIRMLLEDRPGHAADSDGLAAAIGEVAHLDAELRGITDGGVSRSALAMRLGHEIAAGLGLAAVAATLILAALG